MHQPYLKYQVSSLEHSECKMQNNTAAKSKEQWMEESCNENIQILIQ